MKKHEPKEVDYILIVLIIMYWVTPLLESWIRSKPD